MQPTAALLALFPLVVLAADKPSESDALAKARGDLKSANVEVRRAAIKNLIHSDLSDKLREEMQATLKDASYPFQPYIYEGNCNYSDHGDVGLAYEMKHLKLKNLNGVKVGIVAINVASGTEYDQDMTARIQKLGQSAANRHRAPACSDHSASSASAIPSANGNAADSTIPAHTIANVRLDQRAGGPHSRATIAVNASDATATVATASPARQPPIDRRVGATEAFSSW